LNNAVVTAGATQTITRAARAAITRPAVPMPVHAIAIPVSTGAIHGVRGSSAEKTPSAVRPGSSSSAVQEPMPIAPIVRPIRAPARGAPATRIVTIAPTSIDSTVPATRAAR